MLERYLLQAWFLLEEGALPGQVDGALEDFGMAMGPFRMSDLAGNDIGWAIRQRRYAERPGAVYSKIADEICKLGRFGQKTGAGWYRYQPGQRDAQPDPEIETLIVGYSKAIGAARRTISDAEIVNRCVFALVNEGAKILAEGIALRASDIDVVYLTGYGFPVFRGGPMFYADQVGLGNIVQAMDELPAWPGAIRGSGSRHLCSRNWLPRVDPSPARAPRTETAAPGTQVPGKPCTIGKKNSFQLAGRVLIMPILNMKSANTIVAFGVAE